MTYSVQIFCYINTYLDIIDSWTEGTAQVCFIFFFLSGQAFKERIYSELWTKFIDTNFFVEKHELMFKTIKTKQITCYFVPNCHFLIFGNVRTP